MDEYESLSHTQWECKYHVIFIPRCRRKKLYGDALVDKRDCDALGHRNLEAALAQEVIRPDSANGLA